MFRSWCITSPKVGARHAPGGVGTLTKSNPLQLDWDVEGIKRVAARQAESELFGELHGAGVVVEAVPRRRDAPAQTLLYELPRRDARQPAPPELRVSDDIHFREAVGDRGGVAQAHHLAALREADAHAVLDEVGGGRPEPRVELDAELLRLRDQVGGEALQLEPVRRDDGFAQPTRALLVEPEPHPLAPPGCVGAERVEPSLPARRWGVPQEVRRLNLAPGGEEAGEAFVERLARLSAEKEHEAEVGDDHGVAQLVPPVGEYLPALPLPDHGGDEREADARLAVQRQRAGELGGLKLDDHRIILRGGLTSSSSAAGTRGSRDGTSACPG